MSDQSIELTKMFFLVEDWLNSDPVLSQQFNVWPEIAVEHRYKGHQAKTRWILKGVRNCCYMKEDGVWIMDPVVDPNSQVSASWTQLNHADPKFFDKLRSYLVDNFV